MTTWTGTHTIDGTRERLAAIAEDPDPLARRKRAAAVLLQVNHDVYLAVREAALELGLLDEAGLRRVEVVRAQELPEPSWRFQAFKILDRPFRARGAAWGRERDADEQHDNATVYQGPDQGQDPESSS